MSAIDPPLLPGGEITVNMESRMFDGVRMDVFRLDAGTSSVITDTLGAWKQEEKPPNDGQFHLRHRQLTNLRLTISVISDEVVPVSVDAWRLYLENVRRRLGPEARIEEKNEPGTPGSMPAVAGLPTREALVVYSPGASQPERSEWHVLASSDSLALLATLSGPNADVERAKADLQFLLSRLARR